MSRIIDADALFDVIRGKEGAKVLNHSPVELLGIKRLIDNAPTIDAITVEWLEDKELDYRTTGDKMFSDAFAVVLGEWQKEQEGS